MQGNVLEAENQRSQPIEPAQTGWAELAVNHGELATKPELVALEDAVMPAVTPGGPLKWLQENPSPAYAQRSAAEIDADIEAARNSWD